MTGTCFKLTTTILFAGFEILVEVSTEKFLLLHCTFPSWLKLVLADAWLFYIEIKNNNGNNSDTCMHAWEKLCLPHVVIDNTASRCCARRKVQHLHLFDWNHRETSLTVLSCSQVKARQESVTTYFLFIWNVTLKQFWPWWLLVFCHICFVWYSRRKAGNHWIATQRSKSTKYRNFVLVKDVLQVLLILTCVVQKAGA